MREENFSKISSFYFGGAFIGSRDGEENGEGKKTYAIFKKQQENETILLPKTRTLTFFLC